MFRKLNSEEYLRPSQTAMEELFYEESQRTIIEDTSIMDVWPFPKYTLVDMFDISHKIFLWRSWFMIFTVVSFHVSSNFPSCGQILFFDKSRTAKGSKLNKSGGKYCRLMNLRYFRNSRLEVFCKKGVLENFAEFTGKHLCQSSLLKKRLWHRCFPVNLSKFLRAPFL